MPARRSSRCRLRSTSEPVAARRQRATDAPPPDLSQDAPADPLAVARTICLRLLTARARTRSELAGALRRRGVPDEAADQVLVRLAQVGLIDDSAFAQAFARTQVRDRGLARRAVAAGLRRRGVNDEVVESTVARIGSEEERAAAQAVARRKMRGLMHLDPAVQARRLLAALARRGFTGDVAWQVVREILPSRGFEAGPDAADDDPMNLA